MSNASGMRSYLVLLAAIAPLGMMFGGGTIGMLLMLGLIAGGISQRHTLFVAPSLSFSPWLLVLAGLLVTAGAVSILAIPDLGGAVRWGLIFLVGYAGILTALVGLGLVLWRPRSGR